MPTLDLERALQKKLNLTLIAGVDEAGRGAIAGPVVAAAVILPLDRPEILERLHDVDDSKQLSSEQRELLYDVVTANALAFGVASVSATEIDEFGIIPANALAMQAAISALNPTPEYLLIDGLMKLKNLPIPQNSVIRGDGLSLSIAAASILAKVHRDRQMITFDKTYPHYGFAQHKGYCTHGHVATLFKHGPCLIHRHSFAPLRPTLV
jgi:ribonuclease HII